MQQIGVILVIFVLLWTPAASFSLKDVGRSWLRQTVSSFNSPTRIAMDLTIREIDPTIKYMPSFNLNDEDGEGEEEEGDEDEGETQEDGEAEAGSPLISASEPAGLGLVKGVKFPTTLNGSDVRVGIIMTRWNSDIIQGLYKGVNESLTACGVKPEHVFSTYVPGAFELPVTAKFLAMSKRFDVILCLGCLIKGETMHFEYIAQATSQGIMQVGLDSLVPCVFGVLTVLNEEQARKRSSGEGNEGVSWGKTAVEMGLNRISALGMDKPKKQKTPSSQFVTFNGDVTSKGKEDAEKSSKTQRKIGF